MSHTISDRSNPSRQLKVNDDGSINVVLSSWIGTADHSTLTNLSYASSGHTGFQESGNYATTGHTVHNIGTTADVLVDGVTLHFVNGLFTGSE